ncbi:MAG TPA: TlpA disulfide reductase family protein [Blastocatellia bacterium]|nr:TlpA disulfide reductase family protein [Blastocatellia bacterium]
MLTRLKAMTVGLAVLVSVGATAVAQDLSFSAPSGQIVTLSSMHGKVTVLLFSGVQDPQCRDALKALEALADRFRGKPVQVYWVSVNAMSEASNDQLKTPCGVNTSVPVLRDGTQAAFKRFSGKRAQLPTVVVLDAQGNPFGQPRGGFNPNSDFVNDLASIIDSLLRR